MNLRLVPLALVAAVSLTACVADDASPPAGTVTVSISQSRFETRELRVPAGTTVVFENTDAAAHTVTSADGSPLMFDSGEFGQGETFEITFDEPGEYPYFCVIHPTMRATVVVE